MTIGLSFEEYFELKLKPCAGADPVCFQAAEQERDGMFRMPLVSVASHLRSRGYDCRPQSRDLLLGHITDGWPRFNWRVRLSPSGTTGCCHGREPVVDERHMAKPRMGRQELGCSCAHAAPFGACVGFVSRDPRADARGNIVPPLRG